MFKYPTGSGRKDVLGQEVNVGDIIVNTNGNYSVIQKTPKLVVGFTPTKIRTTNGGLHLIDQIVKVNDILIARDEQNVIERLRTNGHSEVQKYISDNKTNKPTLYCRSDIYNIYNNDICYIITMIYRDNIIMKTLFDNINLNVYHYKHIRKSRQTRYVNIIDSSELTDNQYYRIPLSNRAQYKLVASTVLNVSSWCTSKEQKLPKRLLTEKGFLDSAHLAGKEGDNELYVIQFNNKSELEAFLGKKDI